MRPRLIAMLLMAAAGPAWAQPVPTAVSSEPAMRIYAPPPVQWDHSMMNFRPALRQGPADFYNLTGGVAFGMSPVELNARLPDPYPALSWAGLALANDYPGDVRYFGTPIATAGPLGMGVTACTGTASTIVALFTGRGLFRLSYRLTGDKTCADTGEAARQIFARYVTIGQTVALSVRYRTGETDVVDVTDPAAGHLIPTRWRQGVN